MSITRQRINRAGRALEQIRQNKHEGFYCTTKTNGDYLFAGKSYKDLETLKKEHDIGETDKLVVIDLDKAEPWGILK